MAQGKAWNKNEVLEELKQYFLLDYSKAKACELAQFPITTLNTWIEHEPELRMKINAWRGLASAQARKNIVDAISPRIKKEKKITKDGEEIEYDVVVPADAELSKWWLERRERKAFSTRNEVGLEEVEHVPLSDKTKERMEKYGE